MGKIKKTLNGLYALTDSRYVDYDTYDEILPLLFKGGVKILQYRDKTNSEQEFKKNALKIQEICNKYNVLFVVNDRFDIAIEIKSDALHLGIDEDKDFIEIRKNFSGIIGVSCYGDIQRAIKYQTLGADYVAFGSCYKSSTKPNAKIISLDVLKKAKSILSIPVCAIGGINLDNISNLKNINVDMVSIVSDLYLHKNVLNHTHKLTNALL